MAKHPPSSRSSRPFLPAFLLVWVLLPGGLCAQLPTLTIERITTEQGLSSDWVTCLMQDKKGFLWIGTMEGLNRYDGNGFHKFKQEPDDLGSLMANYVLCLYEDRSGTMWVGTDAGLARYDGLHEKFLDYQPSDDPQSISGGYVIDAFEDPRGGLWINTINTGLNRMDPAQGTFQHYLPQPDLKEAHAPFSASIGPDQTRNDAFWLCVWRQGWKFYHFNTTDKTFAPQDIDITDLGQLFTIIQDRQGTVWISGGKGLRLYDPGAGTLCGPDNPAGYPPEIFSLFATSIIQDRQGLIWIGTGGNGVYVLDPVTKKLAHFVSDPKDPASLSGNFINSILEDRSGIIWVGTSGNGLNRLIRGKSAFQQLVPATGRVEQNSVTAILPTRAGEVWIGLERHWFYRLDQQNDRLDLVGEMAGVLPTDQPWGVMDIHEDREGVLWIGTNAKGLVRFDPQTRAVRLLVKDPADSTALSDNMVKAVTEDRAGHLWLGTYGGINRLDKSTGRCVRYRNDPKRASSLPSDFVNFLLFDKTGQLWAATDNGLAILDPGTGSFRNFLNADAAQKTRRAVEVRCLLEDHAGNMWAGTGSGLYRFHFPTPGSAPSMTRYSEKDGLPNSAVCSLREDREGRLWINTNKGLALFKNPQHAADVLPNFKTFADLKVQGGPFTVAFTENAAGEMLLGTNGSLVIFQPDSLRDNPHVPPVVLTAFEKFDTRHPELGAIAEPGIADRTEITLSHHNTIFTIHFAALDYRAPGANRYAYLLENFNDNWIQLGTQRQVTFTNLDPGTYVFRVRGCNNDGVWNETGTSLRIIVLPPWWKTWWAYGAYLLLLVAGIATYIRMRVRNLKIRTLELEQAVVKGTAQISSQKEKLEVQARQLQELDHLKTNFYTNITHEFRTPLTVILGMAEQAEGYLEAPPPSRFRQAMNMILRNGRNLLRLINQLLDLSKLDAGTLRLQLVQDEIIGYLGYLLESFRSFAETKNIRLEFEPEVAELYMDFDPEKVQSIVANLVSNAIKFTPADGLVAVSAGLDADSRQLRIGVRDTGIGIPADQIPYIFDRFYQVDGEHTRREEGTGIGLALVRELVKLMDGDIGVESTPGTGTIFTVTLPIRRNAPLAESAARPSGELARPATAVPLDPPVVQTEEALPLLLIVEDNPDVAHYLQACVAGDYQVAVAADGQAGIERALELVPDLIVSDVMMPEKDGFELCETLKNDERSSHIPIVLLTAKADMASRIKGLSRGADAYLAKPFHREELLVQLQNLLELRRKLQARYASSLPPPEAADEGVRIEDRFLNKVRELLNEHLSDEDFGVNEIAAAIHLSPSQLFRKIKAVTGNSPTLYLRGVRLQKGRDLLKTTDLTVAEVAYEVGFSDPAYFSRAFSQEFGVAPRELRK